MVHRLVRLLRGFLVRPGAILDGRRCRKLTRYMLKNELDNKNKFKFHRPEAWALDPSHPGTSFLYDNNRVCRVTDRVIFGWRRHLCVYGNLLSQHSRNEEVMALPFGGLAENRRRESRPRKQIVLNNFCIQLIKHVQLILGPNFAHD